MYTLIKGVFMSENFEDINVPNMSQPPQNPNYSQNPQPQQKTGKKTGCMITGIVMFPVALIFLVITLYYLLAIFSAGEKASAFVAFIVYVFTLGWITYLPGLVCSIVGIVLSSLGISSYSKGIKATCIIFLILNILMLIALLAIGFLFSIMPASLT